MIEKLRPWLAFAALFCALSLINLDVTMITLALPSIGHQFNTTLTELQWVNNTYLLAYAVFVIGMGRIGDSKGHKKSFAIGTILFLIGSIICGFSSNFLELIIGRIIQGLGATGIFPIVMIIVMQTFPPKMHAFVVGLLMISTGVNQAIGPSLGGFLIELLSWRYIFYINIPVCLFSLLLSFFVKNVPSKSKLYINPISTFLIAITSTLLLFTLQDVTKHPLISLCIGLITILLFYLLIHFEKKKKKPLLHLKLYKNKPWRVVNIARAIFQINFGFFLFLIPLYMQNILLISPIINGLLLLIYASLIAISGPITGKYIDKYGLYVPVKIYQISGVLGFILIALGGFFEIWSLIIISFLVIGLYSGVNFSITNYLNVAHLPKKNKGVGSAMYAGLAFYSYALGVSISGLIVYIVAKLTLLSNLSNPPIPFTHLMHFASGVSSLKMLNNPQLIAICKSAFENGLSIAFLIATLFAFISIFYSNQFKKPNPTKK